MVISFTSYIYLQHNWMHKIKTSTSSCATFFLTQTLVQRLIMPGVVPSLLHVPSWCAGQLVLYLYLI